MMELHGELLWLEYLNRIKDKFNDENRIQG